MLATTWLIILVSLVEFVAGPRSGSSEITSAAFDLNLGCRGRQPFVNDVRQGHHQYAIATNASLFLRAARRGLSSLQGYCVEGIALQAPRLGQRSWTCYGCEPPDTDRRKLSATHLIFWLID